jgi:hypothetical protein
MKKRAQIAPAPKIGDRTAVDRSPAPADPTTETTLATSARQGTQEQTGREAASGSGVAGADSGSPAKDPISGNEAVRDFVEKLLIEGSTFEDVVQTANERSVRGVTLSAVKSYFQGNPQLQAKRVRYLVETGESLLAGLGDPDSAEARLAKATFLTGYLNLHQDGAPITPKDAEHARMERANLNLKHKLLVSQRDKARQALRFMEERTRILVLTQQKIKEEIGTLQQDAKRQQAGEPLGPAMLQRIQQIYGLSCQPMLDGGRGDAAKA